jgi:hypothetical protein
MKRGLVMGATLGLLTGSCMGIGMTCTEIGCTDAVLVDISPQEAWTDGAYTLRLQFDGLTRHCRFQLPQNSQPTCDDDRLTADLGDDGELQVVLETAPKELELALLLGDEELLRDVRKPQYSLDLPNGPECDDSGCIQAYYRLSWGD